MRSNPLPPVPNIKLKHSHYLIIYHNVELTFRGKGLSIAASRAQVVVALVSGRACMASSRQGRVEIVLKGRRKMTQVIGLRDFGLGQRLSWMRGLGLRIKLQELQKAMKGPVNEM